MKIAIDAMGGDYGPQNNVKGVQLALQELPSSATVVMVGQKEVLHQLVDEAGFVNKNFEIAHAEDVIPMGVHATKALSQMPRASIPTGYNLLKGKAVEAFCGCGNTGAMHVGAIFSIKAIEGIIRPGIAGFVPKEAGGYGVLMDVGANADCKPDVLVQFAEIASIYAKHIYEIDQPKVGLINLGEEEQKGTLLTQAAFQLLKLNKKLNFVGNIEGRDLFNDKADVMVCDGFTGNVMLKLAESFYDMIKARKINEPFFDRMDYRNVGGSPILGINGNVIIGHGVSDKHAIKNMLIQAYKMAVANMNQKIKESLTS